MGPSFIWGQLGCAGVLLLGVLPYRRAESTSIKRKLELGSVLRALSDAVLLLDERGRIVDLNNAAAQLAGRPRAELIGSSAERLLGDAPGAAPQSESILSRALHGECVRKARQWVRTPGGEPSTLALNLSPVCDTSGKMAGALLAIRDVTEVTHLQSELAQSERYVAVGEMTAGLVHDFSNVLSTISEAVVILDEAPGSTEHDRVVLGIIRNAVRSGGETLGNIRKYLAGKRERGRIEIRRLLEEVLELTNPLLLHKHAGVSVVREMDDCSEVQANQDELRRAFTNLVLNALEAMPQKGTLTIGCRQAQGRVLVTVRDTGTGMAPEVQKKIFSAYFTTKSKGTGLGLAGAQRAIEAQGGQIRFESAPGRGTTFYVTLPALGAQAKEAPEPVRQVS
jgi:PAS domain S-box-containing protein